MQLFRPITRNFEKRQQGHPCRVPRWRFGLVFSLAENGALTLFIEYDGKIIPLAEKFESPIVLFVDEFFLCPLMAMRQVGLPGTMRCLFRFRATIPVRTTRTAVDRRLIRCKRQFSGRRLRHVGRTSDFLRTIVISN